jgi:hypothetical protein
MTEDGGRDVLPANDSPSVSKRLWPHPLWQTGEGLTACPAVGPDGAVYMASRQGTLDVVEPTGTHRFTITLGGAPTGTLFVDPRGWAFVGLATGNLVGITADGLLSVTYHSPIGISGDLGFAEGQGLLLLGHNGIVLGVNRGGFPTLRLAPGAPLTAGPVGIQGWCVVATERSDVIWANRFGRRIHRAIEKPAEQLRATADGEVWALAQGTLWVFSRDQAVVFERRGIRAIATLQSRTPTQRIQGVVVTMEGRVEWLDPRGQSIARELLHVPDPWPPDAMVRVDDEASLWIVSPRDGLHVLRVDGTRYEVSNVRDSLLLSPVFDSVRRRTVLAWLDGAVAIVDWPKPPNGDENHRSSAQ